MNAPSAYLATRCRWSILVAVSIVWSTFSYGQSCQTDGAAHFSKTFDLRQGTECIVNFTILDAVASGDGSTYQLVAGKPVARAELVICAKMRNSNSKQRAVFDLNSLSTVGWQLTPPLNNLITLSHQYRETLTFELTEDGPATISIDLGRGREEDFAPANWRQRQTLQIPTMNIVGIETDEDRFWSSNQDTYEGLARYISRYSSGIYLDQAMAGMNRILQDDYRQWVAEDPTIATVDRFMDKYGPFVEYDEVRLQLDAARVVRQQLDAALGPVEGEPPPPSEEDLELAVFERAQTSGDTSQLLRYIEQYHNPPVRFALRYEEAMDLLLAKRTPFFKILSELNDWRTYQLFNFAEPVYRDIYAQRLEIDDSRLATEGILRLRPLRQSEIAMEILDRQFEDKRLIIEFDNPMQAYMSYDSTGDQLSIVFERGLKPYRLMVIDAENRLPVWSKDGIQSNEIQIDLKELREAKLTGQFLTQAYGRGATRPLEVRNGAFSLTAMPHTSWLPWALLALGILVLAILVVYLISNRKRKPPTIFDQP